MSYQLPATYQKRKETSTKPEANPDEQEYEYDKNGVGRPIKKNTHRLLGLALQRKNNKVFNVVKTNKDKNIDECFIDGCDNTPIDYILYYADDKKITKGIICKECIESLKKFGVI